jgi:hypothetical protein
MIPTIAAISMAVLFPAEADLRAAAAALPSLPAGHGERPRGDWMLDPAPFRAGVFRGRDPREVVLTNGLVRRVFRIEPDGATVALDNLMTGESILRSVRPEAAVTLEGKEVPVGGLTGQPESAYLRPEWLEGMKPNEGAFHLAGFEVGTTAERFAWNRKRRSEGRPWPPAGASLHLRFVGSPGREELTVTIHYEIYDGIPLIAKWFTLSNRGARAARLDSFKAEVLAAAEAESDVERPERWEHPNLDVECDFSFGGFHPKSANRAVRWLPDPSHRTQVNYRLETPCLLEVAPPLGPGVVLESGTDFESFRVFELVHDSTERERRGLQVRRMYRTIAPWATENPLLMHVRSAEPQAVRNALDQCAEVGFELAILTFGSGFDLENEKPDYIREVKGLVDHAHAKGLELGGYSLLASRRISDQDDAINPKTGKPGGAIFGDSPCLGSRWGLEYFRKARKFIEETGLDCLEHDGSYPGDACASTSHPGHEGLADSQWRQWTTIRDFYRWCRGRGVSLNVPDWYFLQGSSKIGMGYRESNWSLPRERQLILARQNIYDGTWLKTPSMGWMFVPLVEYGGGGAAATLEPLGEHLADYEAHLALNLGAGVQACYRGPRLFDSGATGEVVKRWVDFYKQHRDVLEADLIHLRRPDGRDVDFAFHVRSSGRERALCMVHNPLEVRVERRIRLPLYYTALAEAAALRERGGEPRRVTLDRDRAVEVMVTVEARGRTWLTVEAPE